MANPIRRIEEKYLISIVTDHHQAHLLTHLIQALELHPDKNIDDPEKATRLFTQVQAAYEVLSDDHERAWYVSDLKMDEGQASDETCAGTTAIVKPFYEVKIHPPYQELPKQPRGKLQWALHQRNLS